MKPSVYNRIDYKGPIEIVLTNVCKDFDLGIYISFELVPFGYEDFNLILKTDRGRFFVKIFGSFRNKQECKQYVHIMELVYKNGANYPFLYSANKKHLYKLNIDKTTTSLVVQEFIDGKNFIELGIKPTQKEKEFIITQAALINKLDFKPIPVYDSWATVNFENEFKTKGHYLKNFKDEVKKLLKYFKKISINTLPHCFVHGDMIASNIMRNKNGKIYVLDFAVSNYYPRIVELASLICFNFFDPDNPESLKETFNFTVKTYQSIIPLKKAELDLLPLFIKTSFAMYLIRASYEKVVNGNNTEENNYWLKVGTAGLKTIL